MSRSMALVLVLLVLFLTSQSEWKPPRTPTDLSGKKLDTEEGPMDKKIQADIILELMDENYHLKKLVEALNVQLQECKKKIPNLTISDDVTVGEVGQFGDANIRTEERSQLEEKNEFEDAVVETPREREGAYNALVGVGAESNTEESSGENGLEGGKTEGTVEARENASSSSEEGIGQRRRKAAEQISHPQDGDTKGVSLVANARDVPAVEQTVDWVVPRYTLTSLSKVRGEVATSPGQVPAEESAESVFVDGIRSIKEGRGGGGGGPSRPIEHRHGADQARVHWAKDGFLGGHRVRPSGRYRPAEVGSI